MTLDSNLLEVWPWERNLSRRTRKYRPEKTYADVEHIHPRFKGKCYDNHHLDFFTKTVALKAGSFVVSVVAMLDDEQIFQGSGTIIEDDGVILTSAKLLEHKTSKDSNGKKFKVLVHLSNGKKSFKARVLAYDLHFNIAFIKIKAKNITLTKACLKPVDDYISLQMSSDVHPVLLPCRPKSSFNLIPGEKVIALGRYMLKPYGLMAAPGQFSVDRCEENYDCKVLFMADCLITSAGEGGPLVNHDGEVIGVTFDDLYYTPFLPINVAIKWWKHYKKYKVAPHQWPVLGMGLSNLYAANMDVIENFIRKNPDILAGVIVEEVVTGSAAESAGICCNDIIVECCGKNVKSILELFDILWDKAGCSVVELIVMRASENGVLSRVTKVCSVNAG